MAKEPSGNIRGLKPSEIKAIKKLFGRRISREEIVSLDLAREVYGLAGLLRRRIGLLISREGHVEEVCVGTKDILYLPDLGRHRLGQGRLRALRLVFSDLSDGADCLIPQDNYTDLEKLRLDMVAAVKVSGNRSMMTFSHIVPQSRRDVPGTRTEIIPEISRFPFDFKEFVGDLENQLSRLEQTQRVSSKLGAVLVGVHDKREKDVESYVAELEELARTAGVEVLDKVIQRRTPDPKTVIGKGKLEEVVLRCLRSGAEVIIFDTELRPSQWRAITNQTELKVIDRSMLILDIFAQHARSSDGRLQVELAQLRYTLPRLVEKDSGLSRLTGGIGGRGPGETKLEVSRRRVRERISELEKRIKKLGEERNLRRQKRKENQLPLVSILGYTNAGKSTLFNSLTGAAVLVENKLFATLDPAQRKLVLPPKRDVSPEESGWGRQLILSDTVGFIRHLPQELSNAFRATLEEIREADLLLHVMDASDRAMAERKAAVEAIIAEMGVGSIPRIDVINKIDLCTEEEAELLAREYDGIAVSASKGTGLHTLLGAIDERIQK